MGWTGTWPCVAGGPSIADPAFIGQFVKAFAERQLAINQTPVAFPLKGTTFSFLSLAGNSFHYNGFPMTGYPCPWANGTISIRAMQDWIETYCVQFADHVNNPGGFSGAATIAPWTLANLRAAAGLNPAGFKRCYYDSTRTIQTAYGVAVNLDIVGPWLFNELRAMLNLLLWSFTPSINPYWGGYLRWAAGYDPTGLQPGMNGGGTPYAAQGLSWANAKAAVEATYADGNSGGIGYPAWDTGAFAYTRGIYNTYNTGETAYMERGFSRLVWAKISGLTANATFYFKAAAPTPYNTGNAVFDANGDPAASGVLAVADEQTITGAGTKYSAQIGGTAMPTWCAQPAAGTPLGPEEIRGYIGDPTASGWLLAKWNVLGGFAYR